MIGEDLRDLLDKKNRNNHFSHFLSGVSSTSFYIMVSLVRPVKLPDTVVIIREIHLETVSS